MNSCKADADRIDRFLRRLSEYTEEKGIITRQTFSAAWYDALQFVQDEMQALGMRTRVDGFGNLIGRFGEESGRNPIGTGSHLDTVIHGGAYDGATGIACGLEAVRLIRESGLSPQRPIEVIAFAEEEGGVFGKGCLGSEYITGHTDLEQIASLRDVQGRSLGQRQLAAAEGQPAFGSDLGWGKDYYHAFIEVHAEQGNRLDKSGETCAVVDGVVGIFRAKVTFIGQANHAGTTQMHDRKDAMVALARWIQMADAYGREQDGRLVVTNGRIEITPNQHNVIPGTASSWLEMRAESEEEIKAAWEYLQYAAEEVAHPEGLTVEYGKPAYVAPVRFDQDLLDTADRLTGGTLPHLFSWAGHDAKLMSQVTKTMMFFVPSRGGYSHCPQEYSDAEHIAAAAEILADNLLEVSRCI